METKVEEETLVASEEEDIQSVTKYSSSWTVATYHSFPKRIVVESPFQKRICVSYGVIAFAWNTQRWLLIQRKHTQSFIRILCGSYRASELSRLLPRVTTEELQTLKDLSKESFHFNSAFHRVFPHLSVEDIVYAKERFFANGPSFLKYQSSSTQSREQPWEFAKGNPIGRENSVDCALREFREKTGLEVTHQERSFFGRDPFCETEDEGAEDSTTNQRFETRYWVAIFMTERRPPPLRVDEEKIGLRRWMTESEAAHVLTRQKQRILQEAKEFIQDNFLF